MMSGLIDPLQPKTERARTARSRSTSRSVTVVSPPRAISVPPPTQILRHEDYEEIVFIPPAHIEEVPKRTRLQRATAPSPSRMPITGTVLETTLQELGPRTENAMTELMARVHLGNRETRARIPPPMSAQLIAELVEDRVLARRSTGREDHLQSVTKQFLVWLQLLPEGAQTLDLSYRMVSFVEAKQANATLQNKFSMGSALKYLKDLAQVFRETGFIFDEEVVKAVQQAYQKAGALKPEHQAPPATRDEVWRAAQHGTRTESLGLKLAWKLSSRIGEMVHLLRENISEISHRKWSVSFPYHKGDPFRLGTTMILDLTPERDFELAEELKWRMGYVNCTTPLTEITTSRATALLQRVNETLSAHSIKRGSLVTMLRAGVPIPVIQSMAKHKDLETLLIYLPKVEVALAMNLGEASRML